MTADSQLYKRRDRVNEAVPIVDLLAHYGYAVTDHYEQQFSCDLHGDGSDGKPSARVYPDSNHWYCFACGTGSPDAPNPRSPVDTVMLREHLTFAEAITWLERRAGLSPGGDCTPQAKLSERIEKLLEAPDEAPPEPLPTYEQAHYDAIVTVRHLARDRDVKEVNMDGVLARFEAVDALHHHVEAGRITREDAIPRLLRIRDAGNGPAKATPPSPAEAWLAAHLTTLGLSDEHETYLYIRGCLELDNFRTWLPAATDSPDPDFCRQFGPKGECITGWVVIPSYCPRGKLLGFEARKGQGREKKVMKYHAKPRAEWSPTFYGTREAMPLVWAGKDVWILEGVFDVEAMRNVKPHAALLGCYTAKLSKKNTEFLRRALLHGQRVKICFDTDETGHDGAKWAKANLDQAGIPSSVVGYSGKDPGDVWAEQGIDGLREQFGG